MILFYSKEEWISEAIKLNYEVKICECSFFCDRNKVHACESIVAIGEDGKNHGIFKTTMKYGYFYDIID